MSKDIVATFVKDVSDKFQGEAFVYEVSPLVEFYNSDPDDVHLTEYVVVSHVNTTYDLGEFKLPNYIIYETLAFPSDSDGEILSWREIEGFRDANISEFFTLAGWTLTLDAGTVTVPELEAGT